MISPTVGRVVWYRPSESDTRVAMAVRPGIQPLAAIVAHVFDDHLVNLTVFDHDGNSYPRQNVQLVQEGEEKPEGVSFAQWMPFQVGQAKKHEQPQAAIAAPDLAAIEQGLTGKLAYAVDSISATMHKRLEERLSGLTSELHGIVDGRFASLLEKARANEPAPPAA